MIKKSKSRLIVVFIISMIFLMLFIIQMAYVYIPHKHYSEKGLSDIAVFNDIDFETCEWKYKTTNWTLGFSPTDGISYGFLVLKNDYFESIKKNNNWQKYKMDSTELDEMVDIDSNDLYVSDSYKNIAGFIYALDMNNHTLYFVYYD